MLPHLIGGDERAMGGAGRRGRPWNFTAGLNSFSLKAPERAAMDRGGDPGHAQGLKSAASLQAQSMVSEALLWSHLELTPGGVKKGGSSPSFHPHSWGGRIMTGSPPLSDTYVTGSLTADEEGERLQRSRSPVFFFLRSVLLEGPYSSLQLSYTARKVFLQGAELFREEAKH